MYKVKSKEKGTNYVVLEDNKNNLHKVHNLNMGLCTYINRQR